MNALKILKKTDQLYDEVFLTSGHPGRRREFAYNFLSSYGCQSLSCITIKTLKDYVQYLNDNYIYDPTMYNEYKGSLNTVIYTYLKDTGHPLSRLCLEHDTYEARTCIVFLYACGIKDIKDVTAATRREYDEYTKVFSSKRRPMAYLRALDNIVYTKIEKTTFAKKPGYKDKLIYLAYYPDINVIKTFRHTFETKYLYFDFSLPAPGVLKRQIYMMLQESFSHIETYKTPKTFIKEYVKPLYCLYDFCIRYGIDDLKQLTDKEISYLDKYVDETGIIEKIYLTTIIFRARRFLFIHDKSPDFTATMWFVERFNLTLRNNPARTVDTFYFGDVSADNRVYIQRYMKYLLVLSPKYSLPFLRTHYRIAKNFTRYLENKHTTLTEISYADIEGYIASIASKDCKPNTYNGYLASLSRFLTALSLREKLLIPSFPFEYYYKKSQRLHHDRSVSEDKIDRIFMVLPYFPETIGLIFLTLYSTGLRINEVCTMRKEALKSDDKTCWLRVYQYKLKSEKEIPIPEELYRLLRRHIDSDTSGSDYIFPKNTDKSQPYSAMYFWEQMNKQLSLYEETKDIHFKSHDYRHTIATDLHISGAPIGTIREFLGHTVEDMTKQYIDHLQGDIDILQEKYLKEHELK